MAEEQFEDLNEYCKTYFGHGSWKSPVWLLGLEPGTLVRLTKDEGINAELMRQDLSQRLKAWRCQGKPCLTDWHETAKGCKDEERWLVLEAGTAGQCDGVARADQPARPRFQPTYGQLCRILLAGLGRDSDREAAIALQCKRIGRKSDHLIALLELRPLPCKRINGWPYELAIPDCPPYLRDRKRYKQELDPERLTRLLEQIEKHEPKLIVCYGQDLQFDRLAAGLEARRQGLAGEILLRLKHPTAHGLTNAEREQWGRDAASQITSALDGLLT